MKEENLPETLERKPQSLSEVAEERSRLLTLVFTDLVNSVGLKTRLGDTDAGRLIAAHHDGLREICRMTGGREILVAGDGSFLTFETPTTAVEFALRLQEFHRSNDRLPAVRIGIHMGEVTERRGGGGTAQTLDVDGLAVDIASRIQSLARASQILMSYPVFDNARQRLDPSFLSFPVEWRAHGRYVFQGTDMALEIFETGLKGISSFSPPSGSTKAERDVKGDDEHTLGWRPAQGLELPDRHNWILIEKLGEGGFGDVWLIEHRKTRDRHVIKFCYSTDRLRALKREVTLFRLLKETLGDRQDIARVLDYQFEAAPYFLEMEYAGKYNLTTWLEEKGGISAIQLSTRIELVAQVADAIAAAHSVGILHKDIKPSNIMITESGTAKPRIRMIDFGIGALADRNLLDIKGITATGLTEAESSSDYGSSLTGTRLYMAPELIEGKAATTKSDIYSLGVVLYQMVSGKIGHTLSFGWERDIPDELLQQDIEACVDGRPENRLGSAEELAVRLRNLPQRRAAREESKQEVIRQQVSKKRRHLFYAAAALLCLLLVIIGGFAYMQRRKATEQEYLRLKAEAAQFEAQKQANRAHRAQLEALNQANKAQHALLDAQRAHYFGAIALAEASLREHRFEKAQEVLLNEAPADFRHREWGWLLAQTSPENFALKDMDMFDAAFTSSGATFVTGKRDAQGKGHLSVYSALTGTRHSDLLTNNRLVWNLDLSPDGKLAATASSDNVVAIVNLASNTVAAKLTSHTGIIRDVAFSPDGRLLASCSRDKTIRLWDATNFNSVRVIEAPGDSFTEIAFSPDSRYLVSGSLETHARIFDVDSGEQVAMLAGHEDRVLSVAFLKNNEGVITGCKDGVARLYTWPPSDGEPVLQPRLETRTPDSYPAQVISAPDGESFYIGNDNGSIVRVDAENGLKISSLQIDQPLWKLAISIDGSKMITTTRWSVRLLDLERLEGHCTVIDSPALNEIPSSVVSLAVHSVPKLRDQTWNADQTWRSTTGLSLVNVQDRNFLITSAYDIYSPDRLQRISINPETLHAHVISTTSSRRVKSFAQTTIPTAAFSPDGNMAAVLMDNRGVAVYDTASWERIYMINKPGISPTALTFTSNSAVLAVAYANHAVEVYDASNGVLRTSLTPPGGGSPLSIDISSDGLALAVGMDIDLAHVFDLTNGKHVSTMSGHVRYIHGVKFAPSGQRLATLSRDGTVKLWDTDTGRELVTMFHLENGAIPLGLYFAPNGRYMAASTSDRRVIISDIFPWNASVYGEGAVPLATRVELWKRRSRMGEGISLEDVMPEEVVGPPGLEPGTSRL